MTPLKYFAGLFISTFIVFTLNIRDENFDWQIFVIAPSVYTVLFAAVKLIAGI